MEIEGEREIRAALAAFLAENRHGGIKKLVDASGLSRPTVSRIAGGDPVSPDTLTSIKEALAGLGYETQQGPIGIEMTPRDAMALIADELSSLVNVLRSPELPENYKAGRLASWVRVAHRDLLKSLEDQ